MENFAERLKRLRTERGLSLRDVSNTIDVSPSTYRAWELGTEINGEPYMKLAKIFDVSLVELMTGEKTEINIHLEQIERSVQAIRSLM